MGLLSKSIGTEGRTRRSHTGLIAGIERARALSTDREALATDDPSVSGWSVGLHLEHLWKAERGILGWVESALDEPGAFPSSGEPSKTGSIVLISGWIPRGRAKAPERSLPDPEVGYDLSERLAELRVQTDRLEPRLAELHACGSTFEHPLLGHFTPAQWLRFLDVHHRHHEKIIRDIR
ncbi:MAG: DinB family protein [Gemmatimonadota bacterium]|nr:DinB family protein [Gemmatimonadota bacterium]